jgi:hypothetical protein
LQIGLGQLGLKLEPAQFRQPEIQFSVFMVPIISSRAGKLVGPCVDDGVTIDVLDTGRDALFEFLLRCYADVVQDRAGEFGEEALDEVDSGTMLGREGELEEPTGRAASQVLVSLQMSAE